MLGPDPKGYFKRDMSRLASFQMECRAFATLRGFKYFDLLMRSRDEFLLFIPRKDVVQSDHSSLLPRSVALAHYGPATDGATPIEKQQQRPPMINPRNEMLEEVNDRYTIFLVGAYAKYNCPYVHRYEKEKEVKFDVALELQTTNDWKRKKVEVWEMVLEILSDILEPYPPNPFQVDLAYIDRLPMEEGLLLTGALLNFLQTLWSHATPSHASLVDAVYEDIKALQTRHLSHMYEYSIRGQPPQ